MSVLSISVCLAFASATGFFRPVQVDGRWCMARSGEKPFTILSTSHVSFREESGKSLPEWVKETSGRLSMWGFNTVGNPIGRNEGFDLP